MTLQIHPVTKIEASDLRNLVIDNLGSLLGEDARLVESIPQLEGCCLAVSDTQDGPVLLSFDVADPGRALLTGLARMDQLGSDMAALFLQDYQPPARLLVLAPAAPPGASLFGESCPVGWRRIQVLSVNDELGMVIDPVVEEGATGSAAATPIPLERRPTIVEAVLNPEEEQHFSQL